MILDVYKDALEYSAQDWTALIKLGIITVVGMIVILPLFLTLGYVYRVLKVGVNGMINGEDKLPEFNEWSKMFVDGIKLFVVSLVYAIIPIILFVGMMALASSVGESAGVVIAVIGILIFILLTLLLSVMAVIGMANMAENDDKLAHAFDINGIIEIIKSIGLINAVGTWFGAQIITGVFAFVVYMVLYVILLFLGLSTAMLSSDVAGGVLGLGSLLILAIINLLVVPYTSIFQYRVYGLLYNLQ